MDLSLLYRERNIYSTISVAIDKLTPVHLTEWSISQLDHDSLDNSRRVDFWCLFKDGKQGKPLNFFIEVKKGWYCLNQASNESLHCVVEKSFSSLIDQIKTIKATRQHWGEFNDAYLGVFVIEGYYSDGKEYYDETYIIKNLKSIMKSSNLDGHLLLFTWFLPEHVNVQWEKNKCRFITIACIVQQNTYEK